MLKSGTLLTLLEAQTERALKLGALHSCSTDLEILEEAGTSFLVRVLANMNRKKEAKQKQKKDFNPFLPYEEELFVCDLSSTHVCLLNKFNVVEGHLLMITREFESQLNLLTLADMEAMRICLEEFVGLAFYNGGQEAGASQRHKHLQMVPLPLLPGGTGTPMDPLFTRAFAGKFTGECPDLPFRHGLAPLETGWWEDAQGAARILELYLELLKRVGFKPEAVQAGGPQPGAYNLLLTRDWMFLVPRLREFSEGISINSLGFAGSFFVQAPEQKARLVELGALSLLRKSVQD